MDENKNEIVEETEESRREFITKAVGAAGAMLAAGLLGASQADGAAMPTLARGAIKTAQLDNGAQMTIPANHLAGLIGRENLNAGAIKNLDMRALKVTLEW